MIWGVAFKRGTTQSMCVGNRLSRRSAMEDNSLVAVGRGQDSLHTEPDGETCVLGHDFVAI